MSTLTNLSNDSGWSENAWDVRVVLRLDVIQGITKQEAFISFSPGFNRVSQSLLRIEPFQRFSNSLWRVNR